LDFLSIGAKIKYQILLIFCLLSFAVPVYASNAKISTVSFDREKAYEYCYKQSCTLTKNSNRVIYSFQFKNGIPKSDDNKVYLFEQATYEDQLDLSAKEPIDMTSKGKKVVFAVPCLKPRLFARFVPALLVDGEYVQISEGIYISNPEAIAVNTTPYMQVDSKKGLLLDANTIGTDRLYNLNVRRLVYNLPISLIMGESPSDEYPTIDYEYNGKIYKFNGYQLAGFDSLFRYLEEQEIHSTVIILNDWNKEAPEIIHPQSRQRTGSSMYYAFNTEEEDGVRTMEAVALFLAERYAGGEYGTVYDWVIANEVNQQKIWNYMGTSDLEYYTQSFEQSFRTFYNAIKSYYADANVYFSIDHDWNDNGGYNGSFFNGRDFMYAFNEAAKKGGNYDWNLSIHPYPNPLKKVKFWNGTFDKTEEAKVITPMNLSSLTDLMTKKEFLDTKGNVRKIAATELGFTSKPGEKLQAAAFAYCYYIIEDNPYINTFLLNRQTDDTEALKSGLALGIYNNDYSEKELAEVFRNIDSEAGDEYIEEMLEIIGASSLEEALSWAR